MKFIRVTTDTPVRFSIILYIRLIVNQKIHPFLYGSFAGTHYQRVGQAGRDVAEAGLRKPLLCAASSSWSWTAIVARYQRFPAIRRENCHRQKQSEDEAVRKFSVRKSWSCQLSGAGTAAGAAYLSPSSGICAYLSGRENTQIGKCRLISLSFC